MRRPYRGRADGGKGLAVSLAVAARAASGRRTAPCLADEGGRFQRRTGCGLRVDPCRSPKWVVACQRAQAGLRDDHIVFCSARNQ